MSSSGENSYDSGTANNHRHGESLDQQSTEKPHPSEFLEFATVNEQHLGVRLEPLKTGSASPGMGRGSGLEAIGVTRSNDNLYHGLNAAIPNLRRLSTDARAAAKKEHKMTFLSALRLYPKATAWSVLLSMTIVMEGFDLTLVSSFFAFPIFRRAYGTPTNPNASSAKLDYQISPSWQAGLTNAAVSGEIIGLLFNGILTDHLGYRQTMIIMLICMCLFVFLAFFAVNIRMLLASQVLCGLPWGAFQTLSTTYAAEVMPVVLRSYLTSNVNMAWLIGQVTGVGVIRALVHNDSEWSYRIPFGLQWALAAPILVGVAFAPESPWWLVRHEKPELAKKMLLRLTTAKHHRSEEGDGNDDDDDAFDPDETIAMMQHTNEVEKYLNKGGTGYLDCFKGTDLRRTEIACVVWMSQALSGGSLTGYAAYFYEQAGFSTANSFSLAVGMYGVAIVAAILSWFLMHRVGRRTLYLVGLMLAVIILVAGGVLGSVPGPTTTPAISWALGSMIILMTGVYDATIGPVCYVLVAEIPSTRLRVKTVVLARVAYNLSSMVMNILTTKMLNPSAWDIKGKTCYVYAGGALLCLVWCWFRLPEPFGLTYLELDILFEKKARAHKFRQFQVNLASSGYFSLHRSGGEAGRDASAWRGYS
ncbi:hypothetical protein DV736_g3689, partial [Chaetothyriales sp. CBS 134916]